MGLSSEELDRLADEMYKQRRITEHLRRPCLIERAVVDSVDYDMFDRFALAGSPEQPVGEHPAARGAKKPEHLIMSQFPRRSRMPANRFE